VCTLIRRKKAGSYMCMKNSEYNVACLSKQESYGCTESVAVSCHSVKCFTHVFLKLMRHFR
jgi:hypothetical protein